MFYYLSFAYEINKDKCISIGLNCKDIQTCDQCQKNPRCGWCDDGSGTGLGVCMEGSASGPVVLRGPGYSVNSSICPAGQWYFTSCPGKVLFIFCYWLTNIHTYKML